MRPRYVLALLLALAAAPASAQPQSADRLPAAEAAFDAALQAYARTDYDGAYDGFVEAATGFGYNERTTAAYLMAGKAAYAAGENGAATAALTTLVARYPNSRYADEARRVLAALIEGDGPSGPFDLGVVLPAGGETGYLAQALFNGVRLAVDEYNATGPARPVRMVFRDTGGTGDGARTAVNLALREGADALIGPLFSEEAIAAAEAAEREGAVLIAPLATDDAVAAGRRFVFQANPTFPARGRAMARFATGPLRLRRFAVVAQAGTYGAAMADAFEEAAVASGGEVVASARIQSAADWDRLPRVLGAASFEGTDAAYFPVTGDDAPENAADALRGLEAMRLDIRALGNTEWEGLDASRERAGRFRTAFDQDFLVDEGASAAFSQRYRALSGVRADRLALMGYDVTRFLLGRLDGRADAGGDALADALRQAPLYRGLAHRIDFGDGQVNEALFLMGYRGGDAVLLE